MDDTGLRHRVIEAIERLPLIGESPIQVSAIGVRVALTGTVHNPIHRMLIDFTVPKLEGMRELSLDLVVEGPGERVDGVQCGRPDKASNLTRRSNENDCVSVRLDIEQFDWLNRASR